MKPAMNAESILLYVNSFLFHIQKYISQIRQNNIPTPIILLPIKERSPLRE